MSEVISISQSQLKQAESNLAKLDSEIAERQQKRAEIKRWLDAARVLQKPMFAVKAINGTLLPLDDVVPPHLNLKNMPMTEAIVKIANNSPEPISKEDLRGQLAQAGFPDGQLKNYFYTALARLKEREQMTVTDDGRIWKAPK